jgi:hypothetical protein
MKLLNLMIKMKLKLKFLMTIKLKLMMKIKLKLNFFYDLYIKIDDKNEIKIILIKRKFKLIKRINDKN